MVVVSSSSLCSINWLVFFCKWDSVFTARYGLDLEIQFPYFSQVFLQQHVTWVTNKATPTLVRETLVHFYLFLAELLAESNYVSGSSCDRPYQHRVSLSLLRLQIASARFSCKPPSPPIKIHQNYPPCFTVRWIFQIMHCTMRLESKFHLPYFTHL